MRRKILAMIMTFAMIFAAIPFAHAGEATASDLVDLLPGNETAKEAFLKILDGGILGNEESIQEIKELNNLYRLTRQRIEEGVPMDAVVATSDPKAIVVMRAIRDAGRIGQLLELMEKTDVRLVVNRLTSDLISVLDLTVDDIMDQAGLPLLGLVPEDPRVLLSAAKGKPLLEVTRRGAAAACRRIAKRLAGKRVKIKL